MEGEGERDWRIGGLCEARWSMVLCILRGDQGSNRSRVLFCGRDARLSPMQHQVLARIGRLPGNKTSMLDDSNSRLNLLHNSKS